MIAMIVFALLVFALVIVLLKQTDQVVELAVFSRCQTRVVTVIVGVIVGVIVAVFLSRRVLMGLAAMPVDIHWSAHGE